MAEDFRMVADFADSPKIKKLVIRLGEPAFRCWVRLLGYVRMNRPNGRLRNMDELDIAAAASWNGDPKEFIEALIEIRLLDRAKNGSCKVHNWAKYNPYAMDADKRRTRAQKAARVKWNSDSQQVNKLTRSARLAAARKIAKHTKQEWAEMVEFFGGLCVSCRGASGLQVERDHIVPIYQGSSDGIENIQPLCAKCNAKKGPENHDYRIDFCKDTDKQMPDKWLGKIGTPAQTPTNDCGTTTPHVQSRPVTSSHDTKRPDQSRSIEKEVVDFVEKYHEICVGFKVVRIINNSRRGKIRQRLKELATVGITVEEYMQKISNSKFLRGEKGDWDGADFDFIIGAQNIGKILEGRYDNKKGKRGQLTSEKDYGPEGGRPF